MSHSKSSTLCFFNLFSKTFFESNQKKNTHTQFFESNWRKKKVQFFESYWNTRKVELLESYCKKTSTLWVILRRGSKKNSILWVIYKEFNSVSHFSKKEDFDFLSRFFWHKVQFFKSYQWKKEEVQFCKS